MGKLKLFYSGSTSGKSLPEQALIDKPSDIMLTFFEVYTKRGDTKTRFFRHERRRKKEKKSAKSSRKEMENDSEGT